jgi:hypothetical protein
MRRAVSLLAAASAAAMLLPSAAGAVTVGAPLNLTANAGVNCQTFVIFGVAPGCTLFGSEAGGAWTSQTPPGSWTITRARVRTGLNVGPMVFTVMRAFRSQAGSPPAGIICCTAPSESPVFTPAPNTVNELAVNLPAVNTVENIDGEPVEVVDYLGVSMLDLNSSLPVHVATSAADPAVNASFSYFIPPVRVGQQAIQAGGRFESAVLVNGEYQPAPATTPVPETVAPVTPPLVTPLPAPFRLLPGLRLLPGGTRARLGVDAPGPGLLRAFSPLAGRARTSSVHAPGEHRARRKGKRKNKLRKPRLLIPAHRRIKQAGKAYITVKLTKAGKRRLRKQGKLRLALKIVFKPDGGSVTRLSRTVTFRR